MFLTMEKKRNIVILISRYNETTTCEIGYPQMIFFRKNGFGSHVSCREDLPPSAAGRPRLIFAFLVVRINIYLKHFGRL